jgi:ribosomal protein S18 acetylase RimI-like enzyme
MIKIEQLIATDSTQMRALLRHQDELIPYESFCVEDKLLVSAIVFWQHWLACRFHLAPAVYIAKENGVLLGLISVSSYGKANTCWKINHLVVHPSHRGRGIAQKLLQYVFALFGSQGVSHFVTEISCRNSPALSLLAGLGFRRVARVVHYQMPSAINKEDTEQEESNIFRWACSEDKELLCQLFQDSLPSDLRTVYAYQANDFVIKPITNELIANNPKQLSRLRCWYWVAHNKDRNVLTAAIKVTSHRPGDYHFEFVIHPGWQHMADEAVNFVKEALNCLHIKGMIVTKIYDYQAPIGQALEAARWESQGEFLLLVKEHWLRAKKRSLKLDTTVTLPGIAKPAINMPFKMPESPSG